MCGIAGIVNLRDDLPAPGLEKVIGMAGRLRHRGPEELGAYRDRRAALGHARLPIIDLMTGQQPMSNETGTLWLVLNGEIFNYVELARELRARGHRFKTRSDSEVVIHAYEEWGEEAFTRFNGQWAAALWDARTATLVLARDPFGICPLHVCEHAGRLYFASEVKAIFAADAAIPREFDPVGFEQLLTFWAPVAPRTVFRNVEEVEPGHVRTYSRSSLRIVASWAPGYPENGAGGFRGSLEEAVEAVRAALEEATRLRMLRADVPVGSYLSGGLDSSLVATLGLRAKGSRFSTFSLRFEDPEYDEAPFQRLMAARLGTEHHEVTVTRDDIARVFPEVVEQTERPVLRTAPAPLFLLSRLVHDAGMKVVVTGEGSDEMFGGYDIFREARVRRFWARRPDSVRRPRLLERLYPYLSRSPVAQQAMARQFFGQHLEGWREPGFGHDLRWRGTGALKRLLNPDFRPPLEERRVAETFVAGLPPGFALWSPLAQDQYIEIRTLLSGYLLSSQGDRMLMAHSVEGRFPFLDRNVAALADSLPASYKLRVLDEKHVLKRVAAGILPPEILRRKKQPYRAPDALALGSAQAADWIDEVASGWMLEEAGVFTRAARQVIDKCRSRATGGQFSNTDNMAFVAVVSTQLLFDGFIRRQPEAGSASRLRTVVDRLEESWPV